MEKSWPRRMAVIAGASVALVAGMSTAASAADKRFYLEDREGNIVGSMRHEDSGDWFHVYDLENDGYHVIGKLYSVSDNGNVDFIDQRETGNGHSHVYFKHNILSGQGYQMRLCHEVWGCDTVGLRE